MASGTQSLQMLDNRPLCRCCLHRMAASHRHIRWTDDGIDQSGGAEELLQAVHTVARVKRQLTIGCERLVSDAFNRFGHREHACRLTELLFLGAVCSDPFRNVQLLLFVQRELRSSILTISLFLAPQI